MLDSLAALDYLDPAHIVPILRAFADAVASPPPAPGPAPPPLPSDPHSPPIDPALSPLLPAAAAAEGAGGSEADRCGDGDGDGGGDGSGDRGEDGAGRQAAGGDTRPLQTQDAGPAGALPTPDLSPGDAPAAPAEGVDEEGATGSNEGLPEAGSPAADGGTAAAAPTTLTTEAAGAEGAAGTEAGRRGGGAGKGGKGGPGDASGRLELDRRALCQVTRRHLKTRHPAYERIEGRRVIQCHPSVSPLCITPLFRKTRHPHRVIPLRHPFSVIPLASSRLHHRTNICLPRRRHRCTVMALPSEYDCSITTDRPLHRSERAAALKQRATPS